MPLRRHARPIYQANTSEDVRRKWLRLLNVRHYLSLRPLSTEGLELQTSEPLHLYRDAQALPRAFWVGAVRHVPTDEAEETVSSTQFDPGREVVLESDAQSTGAVRSRNLVDATSMVPAKLDNYTATHVSIQTTAPAAGHLVVMDSYYPGWKVLVDGQPASLLPANWVGRAVPVSAGEHTVRMQFEPQSVRIGIFITLLTLAVIAATASAAVQKKHQIRSNL